MGLLGDRLGQQSPLIEAHIAWRRADESAHSMALHVLGHVKSDQVDPQDVSQLTCGLSLTNARRARKQEGTDGLVDLAQPRSRHLDGGGQHIEGFVLTEHHTLEIALERLELAPVVVGHVSRRNTGDLGHDVFHLRLGDGFLALRWGQDPLRSTRLVNDIDRFVRQVPVIDVASAQLGGSLQGSHRILDAVVLLEPGLEPLENLHRLGHTGLNHVDLLKPAR